jgi:tetratricopeptide (TPR) repeat protein
VGPFQLTELLGEGGMGQVWKGARNDGLFDQVVAVKLVHAHLALLAARRFAEERRILARLEHPNIARLIDGGVLEDGEPFLVMEYVDGRPIDAVAAELPEAARVGLFLQAADAVQFAHGRLIVHADLKPSNIAVDGAGRVRLLDFGIARLLGDEAEGELSPMTRDYASPARLAGAAPVVADDVFALGLVLRDLVRTSRDADLLAIADKARAEDAEARYGSVAALIADLGRWRDGLPVQARPDSVGYRARKFVRRHRWGVAMTAMAIIALTTTSVVATVSYVRAERAQAEARARFDQVRGTARYLLFDLGDRLDRQPQSLALRADVARVSQTYLDALSRSPHAPMAVRAESAQGLLRLAERQGKPGRPNLGQTEQARRNLATAYDLARTIPGVEGRRLMAQTRLDQAHLSAMADNDFPATERLLADARRLIFAPDAPAPELQRAWWAEMAGLRQWQGRYADSLEAARQGLAAPQPREPRDALLAEANLYDLLAETTYYAGRPQEAVAPYRRRMALLEEAARRWPDDPRVARLLPRSRWALGLTLLDLGRAPEAAPILAKGVAEARAVAAFDTADADAARTAETLDDAQAQNFAAMGRPAAAIPILAATVDARRQRMMAQPDVTMHARDYVVALIALGDVEAPAGRRAAACAHYDQAGQVLADLRRSGRYAALDDSASTRLLAESRARWCQSKGPARR